MCRKLSKTIFNRRVPGLSKLVENRFFSLVFFLNSQQQCRVQIPTSFHRGVDVMITIFGDFRQFSAKKLAFFSKTNVMIKILHNLALF
jgi:hypothetical protein